MNRLQTFAVGFDGSPDARVAVLWTLRLANQVGADVVIVHAVGLLEHGGRAQGAGDIDEAARVLGHEAGIDPGQVRVQVSEGDPCSVLARAADPPIAADLVVVGSRGHRAQAGLLLGSTSLELAEHATVPVVIVPATRADGHGGTAC